MTNNAGAIVVVLLGTLVIGQVFFGHALARMGLVSS